MAPSNVIQGCFPNGLPRFEHVTRVAQPLMSGPPAWVREAIARPGQHAVAQPRMPGSPAVQPRTPPPRAHGSAVPLPRHLAGFGGGGGQPLPSDVRQMMEAAFGTSFGDVRVHVGAEAAALGAVALTHGNHIYFAPGRYEPETHQGRQVLGRELAHVVQQRSGRVRNPFGEGIAVVNDAAMEAEAGRMAQKISRVAVVQRQIIADGAEGAGRMEQAERDTLEGLLAHNRKSDDRFQAGDWAALTAKYRTAKAQDAAIPTRRNAPAKRAAKAALKLTYDALIAAIDEKYLGPGNPNWDVLVAEGVSNYQAGGGPNTDPTYTAIGTALWPSINARGPIPDDFWKAIKTAARQAHGAARAGAAVGLSPAEQAKLVVAKASVDAAKARWSTLRVDGAAMPAQVNALGTYGTADADAPWTLLTVTRKTFAALLAWWTAKSAAHTLGSSYTTGLALHVTKVSATHSPKMIYHLTIAG